MKINNKLQLFGYLNWEYHSKFDINSVGDPGQVPVYTGDLKQDAFLLYVQDHYGLVLTKDPENFFTWNVSVIDEQKFTWLLLKI